MPSSRVVSKTMTVINALTFLGSAFPLTNSHNVLSFPKFPGGFYTPLHSVPQYFSNLFQKAFTLLKSQTFTVYWVFPTIWEGLPPYPFSPPPIPSPSHILSRYPPCSAIARALCLRIRKMQYNPVARKTKREKGWNFPECIKLEMKTIPDSWRDKGLRKMSRAKKSYNHNRKVRGAWISPIYPLLEMGLWIPVHVNRNGSNYTRNVLWKGERVEPR